MNSPNWYEHACVFALMKWPKIAAKHRASIAESLAVITPILVSSTKGAPAPRLLRLALSAWVFRMVRNEQGELQSLADVTPPPADIATALAWLKKNSMKVEEAARPANLRRALDALSLKLNGQPASDNTVKRKRAVLSNCLRYAVERDHLPTHPLSKGDWEPPQTDDEIDFRYVPGPRQAKVLIEAVRAQSNRGEHLEAFFGCIYYAGMRPSEIAALKRTDCVLPDDPEGSATSWGELILEESRPEVGAGWTDDGASYEQRGLKRRARRATRSVPIPPILVRLLRTHLRTQGTAPDGRLFRAVRGSRVRSTEYCEVWAKARGKALTSDEASSPLAEVPYSLRHAGISLWLNAGVDPVEVARRAGHSLAVLYRFYAKILRGQRGSNHLIDVMLNEADAPHED